MATSLPPLSSLRAFEAAARHSSFKAAADELAVTPTAISHRIRVLEEHLGNALFVRRVRAVELTAAGHELFAAVHEGFAAITRGVEQLRNPPRASIRLSATPAFVAKCLVPRIAEFQKQHPDVDLHLHASFEATDLHAGMADLAIRYGLGHYPDMQTELLLKDEFIAVASPSLDIARADDLVRHTLIHLDWHRAPPTDIGWRTWFPRAGLRMPRRRSGVHYSEETHAIQSAVAGQGVALLSRVLIAEELRMGLLVQVPGPSLDGLAYYLIRSRLRRPAPESELVGTWLRDSLRSALRESPQESPRNRQHGLPSNRRPGLPRR